MDAAARHGRAVAESYDSVAGLYIELFGDEELAEPEDRDAIIAWATSCGGAVLDAGCGPGHWTEALAKRGIEVSGVDLSGRFLEHARRRYPGLLFQQADLRTLPFAERSLGGVLAWFSLIHFEEGELREALREFHRVLSPGGRLLLGFFRGEGDGPSRFAHKVTPAWAWPSSWLAGELASAGFLPVSSRGREATESQRAQGFWVAVKAPAGWAEEPSTPGVVQSRGSV